LKAVRVPKKDIKRILVCQQRQIGDVLLATPSVSILARAYPDAQIHFLTEAKCTPVLEGNPDIARIWAMDKKSLGGLGSQFSYYRKIASHGFDLVVDFQQLPRCRWVTALSRAKIRLSFTPPWYLRPIYTHYTRMKDGYAAMSKASVLAPLGLSWNGEKPVMYLADREIQDAARLLEGLGLGENDVLVTLDPTHRRPTRQWPAEHFGRLVSLAVDRDPRIKFLFLHGPGEEQVIRDVTRAAQTPENCLVPEKMLTLREMAACIKSAALHFGTCSAPRHMAVALGTPSLVVLGSTSSAWTFPGPEHGEIALDIECRPCNKNTCSDPRCLTELTPEAVLPKFLNTLKAATSAA